MTDGVSKCFLRGGVSINWRSKYVETDLTVPTVLFRFLMKKPKNETKENEKGKTKPIQNIEEKINK